MLLILMGVTASGKTTVGQLLAQRMGWLFADADDYHSQTNRDKMHAGTALTDEDRGPWLQAVHGLLEDWDDNGINGVLACSALKQQYRDLLAAEIGSGGSNNLRFIFLDAPQWLAEDRAANRNHAFATPALVASQMQSLEPPTDALVVELVDAAGKEKSAAEVVDEILSRLALTAALDS